MEKYQYDKRAFEVLEKSRVPFAVYQFINKRVVTLVLSAGFMNLFGYRDRAQAYDVMDNDMYRDTHPDDAARIADAAFRFATEGGEYNVVYRTKVRSSSDYIVIHAQGEHTYTETGARLAVVWYTNEGVYTPGGRGAGNELNVSFNKLLREESITRRSCYDALTGLPNMGYFFELAELGRVSLMAEGMQPVILFFDLCRMKSFNRRYGFAEGDRLLQAFARLLAQRFGNENCAHFGGDHFAAYTDGANLDSRLEKLFAACAELNGGMTLPVRVGVYRWQGTEVETGGACDRAKAACDTMRSSYFSTYRYFTDSILTASAQRQYFIDNLDRALGEGWIQAYYQPVIRAANGQVCDEEALARWIDPERGSFLPTEFTPVLEETKLIYKLDLYMVDEVLKKMRRLKDAGLYVVPSSVNFSRSDFDVCDLVEEVRRRVDEAGISRDMLMIELTESTVGSDFAFMKEQVERFIALGFHVWMDDFGSGYSSLDVLQNIHFDLIKFDMVFMQQFDRSEKSRIILTELMKMASGLGIDTVAEGVENEEQVEFLREIGCTRLQGFYYSEALPMEEILRRYEEGSRIGFENPDEAGYYAAIGRINLYDLAHAANEDADEFKQYFDTLPMAIVEANGDEMSIIRCNKSYQELVKLAFDTDPRGKRLRLDELRDKLDSAFAIAVKQCAERGERVMVNQKMGPDAAVHSFMRRVAVNPVTGTAAVVVVILSVTTGE